MRILDIVAENPFNFGDLALDETFTDREAELAELTADIRNGQNVVVFAPRRYGKSSLVWRAVRDLTAADAALVAYVDLMRTPTKEQLAARLARGDPRADRHSSHAGARAGDAGVPRASHQPVHDRRRRRPGAVQLHRRPRAVGRGRDARAAVRAPRRARRRARGSASPSSSTSSRRSSTLDRHLPALMRSVFQTQPEVSHVYLGSKRSLHAPPLQRRERAVLAQRPAHGARPDPAPRASREFMRERFASTGKAVDADAVESGPRRRRAASRTRHRSSATRCGRKPREGDDGDERPRRPPHSTASCARSTPASRSSGIRRHARTARSCCRRSRPRTRPRSPQSDYRRATRPARKLERCSGRSTLSSASSSSSATRRARIASSEPFLAEWMRRFAA